MSVQGALRHLLFGWNPASRDYLEIQIKRCTQFINMLRPLVELQRKHVSNDGESVESRIILVLAERRLEEAEMILTGLQQEHDHFYHA